MLNEFTEKKLRRLRDKHVSAWKMRREKFGDDAVSHSWIIISIGLWALGQSCYLKTG